MIKSLMLACSLVSAFGIGAISIDPYQNGTEKSLQSTIYVQNSDLVPQQLESFNQNTDSWHDVNLDEDCAIFYPDYAYFDIYNNNFATSHVYLNFSSDEFLPYNDTLDAITSQNTLLYLYNQNYYTMHISYQLNVGSSNICVWVGLFKSSTSFNVLYFVSSDNNSPLFLSNYKLQITTRFIYDTGFEGDIFNDYTYFNVTSGNAIYHYSSVSNAQTTSMWFTDISVSNLTTPNSFDETYENGYTNGYNDGLYAQNSNTSLIQLFLTIGDIPFYIIHQMFSFDVLGTSLFLGLIFLSSLGMVLFIVKKVI